MKLSEAKYWDEQAGTRIPTLKDNIWKRQEIVKRLLESEFSGHNVLEIGVGLPVVAFVLRSILSSNLRYYGTDVSEKFVGFAMKNGFEVFHTDILHLPGENHTRIIALDSLEHINPESREKGWIELNRVMAKKTKIFINISTDESTHDESFDHEFGINEVVEISSATKTDIVRWEPYVAEGFHPDGHMVKTHHIWVELER